MKKSRREQEPPKVINEYGWIYHHLGIPTKTARPNEKYICKYKMYVSGFYTSEFGIEWMRFEDDSPISELVRTVPHIAFEVENLEKAIEGRELIGEISVSSPGIKVAMIVENGAPIELMEFSLRNNSQESASR